MTLSLSPGSRLGPYEVGAPLGAGGMGEVYRATDTKLGRDVAIKVLPAELAADPERLARFEREAKLLASLNHPNIAHVYGFESATLPDGSSGHFLAMELVPGEDLAERLKRGPIPVDEALALAKQIAEALGEAHEGGIVHRDLKPANVKVTPDGKVKVLDFGLAKAYAGDSASGSSAELSQSPTLAQTGTEAGLILGTAAYMSPEQARGKPVDKRADIWAFGVVFYEMLTGRQLFVGETVSDVLAGVLKSEVDLGALPDATPAGVRRLLRGCLERNPRNRLHDIADVPLVIDESGPADGREPARTVASHVPLWGALVAGLGLLAAGFGVGRVGRSHSAASSTPALFTQITDLPGLERQPSLSPDGRSVLYVGDARGNDDIYLLRIGGRKPINLTEDSPDEDSAPVFSPDGSQIAFRSERKGGGIFVMGATGESVRRVTDHGYDPAWSPDGKELVVATEPVRDPMGRVGGSRLWAVGTTGEGKRLISEGDGVGPKWSPDGRWVASWGVRPKTWQRDLWTVAADGSGAKAGAIALTDDTPIDWGVEWSPDGRFLYFSSNRGGTMNLLRIPIDPRSGRALGAPEPVTTPAAWAGSLSFAKDGKRFAFETRDWRADAWKVGFDPDREALQGRPLPILRGQPLQELNWSPDGTSLAFARRSLPWESLGVVRADGSAYSQLTDASSQHRSVHWSPDGQRMLFQSQRGGVVQVWVMRTDGSALQQVSGTEPTDTPVWSPDGRRIAAAIRDGVALFDPSSPSPGEPIERLALAEFRGIYPSLWSWSPDGRALLCRPQRTPGGLFLYSFETRSLRKLDEADEAAAWLPDSRRALFSKRGALLLLDTVTGRRKELLPPGTLPVEGSWNTFSITRDGRSIAYLEARREGDIWLADFGEASRGEP